MDTSKIITVAGKSGLYKLISQTRNGFIIECLAQSRRFPISSKNKVSLLENISIYTTDEKEVSLMEVLKKIKRKEKTGPSLNAKESYEKLSAYFKEILPNYDKARLYESDLRKIFRWYNILQSVKSTSVELSEK